MKAHHYLAILLRCTSIMLLIYGIGKISLIPQLMTYEASILTAAISVLIFMFPFVFSALLWFFPITLSKILIPQECDLDVEPISYISLSSIFISAIGLYLFTRALPDGLYWLAVFTIGSEISSLNYTSENKANVMATALELLLAIFLVVKSNVIASFIKSKQR